MSDEQHLDQGAQAVVFQDDRYQYVCELGAGGMSRVIKAKDKILKRDVAIKLLLTNAQKSPDDLRRFQREAQTAGQLRHAGLVKILDFGLTVNHEPFLVMELVDGISLADHLGRLAGPMSVNDALTMTIEICEALENAHKNGVLHRDIKPGNVVILNNPQKDARVKVIDFGMAKFGSGDQHLTKTGVVFGSPAYMSPEQCAGQRVDERSDIYSLGCVLFEALTGERAFAGSTALETFSMHSSNDRPTLSSKSLEFSEDDFLEDVIARCIAVDPKERYQSCRELRLDLEKEISKAELPQQELSSDTTHGARRLSSFAIGTIVLGLLIVFGIPVVFFVLKASEHDSYRVKMLDDKELRNTKRTVMDTAVLNPEKAWRLDENAITPTGWNQITERDFEHVKEVGNYTKLKIIRQGFNGHGIRYLAYNDKLTYIDLYGNRLDSQGWKEISMIKSLEHLSATIDNTLVVSDLGGLANLPKLNQIRLHADLMTPEIAEQIARIPNLDRFFFFGVREIKPGVFRVLGRSKKLESMQFRACIITPENALEMNSMPRLKTISFFEDMHISSEVARAIAKTKIQEVGISDEKVDPEAISELAKSKAITRVSVVNCKGISNVDALILTKDFRRPARFEFAIGNPDRTKE